MLAAVFPQFLVGLILLFSHDILHEAGITFLGFGLPLKQPAIGVILAESMKYLSVGMWRLAFFPGVALVGVAVLWGKGVTLVLQSTNYFDLPLKTGKAVRKNNKDAVTVKKQRDLFQRFCIARALSGQTKYIIADESSTMLDLITQNRIWTFLLTEIKRRNIGLIFVSHSDALAKRIATRKVTLEEQCGGIWGAVAVDA